MVSAPSSPLSILHQTQVPALRVQSLSHWTTGEAPCPRFLIYKMRMLLLINICIIVTVKHNK